MAAATPKLKTGLQAGGERANELKLLFSEANLFARKSDYAQALGSSAGSRPCSAAPGGPGGGNGGLEMR